MAQKNFKRSWTLAVALLSVSGCSRVSTSSCGSWMINRWMNSI